MLDIIIPVYNEGDNVQGAFDSLQKSVKTPFRVLLCYDHDTDTTLPIAKNYIQKKFPLVLVKNQGKGAFGAILTGFQQSTSGAVVVFMADDTFNAPIIDEMYTKFMQGCDIVAASRFMRGGCMVGAPLVKMLLARFASFLLYAFTSLPCHDATNAFRLFSRKVLDQIPIESNVGFTFSFELLAKTHRLGWKIEEVPAQWFERVQGKSRFQTFKWVPYYLKWFNYIMATTFFKKNKHGVEK